MTADEIIKQPIANWTAEEAEAVKNALDSLMQHSRERSAECRELAEAAANRQGNGSEAERLHALIAADEAEKEKRRAYLAAYSRYLGIA